jgi:hypothetical protein
MFDSQQEQTFSSLPAYSERLWYLSVSIHTEKFLSWSSVVMHPSVVAYSDLEFMELYLRIMFAFLE